LTKSTKRAFLWAILLGSNLSIGWGQNSPQSPWTAYTTSSVRPEKRSKFEGYLKRWVAACRKAGVPWFHTFETFAGDTTEYITIMPVMRFGDLDGSSPVERVVGQAQWKHFSNATARCYTSQTRQYATPHTESEINKTGALSGAYWIETRTLAAPGKMNDYLIWLRDDYRPALEKAGVRRFEVSQPVFGAVAGEIITTRMLNDLADIDSGPVLSKALNDEDARAMAAKSGALASSSSTRILRLRSDLSY